MNWILFFAAVMAGFILSNRGWKLWQSILFILAIALMCMSTSHQLP